MTPVYKRVRFYNLNPDYADHVRMIIGGFNSRIINQGYRWIVADVYDHLIDEAVLRLRRVHPDVEVKRE